MYCTIKKIYSKSYLNKIVNDTWNLYFTYQDEKHFHI